MLHEPLKPAERGDAPFRARLRARDGMRPQSTLAILAGYEPKEGEGTGVLARERPARPVAAITTATAIPQARPEPRRIPPAGRPEAWAPPARPHEPARPRQEIRKAPVVVVPPVEEETEADAEEDRATGLGRFGEYTQLAFAGLAVLGLAGLSLLAIDSALKGKPGALPDEGEDTARRSAANLGPAVLPASVSAVAVQEAALPVGVEAQPWFDYRGVADYLKNRVDAFAASERDAVRREQADAQRLASAAIADAEAGRLAAAAQVEADALVARDAAIDAERQRLARLEAERIANEEAARLAAQAEADALARAEADRLARMEADRAAAALADQRRLAELEAERAAAAEASRLAEIESRRVAADAEAKRLADLAAEKAAAQAEQQRLADLAAKRGAEDEARRLAALDAKRVADAADARRLAEVEARRLANLEAQRQAAQKAGERTLTLAAATVAPAPPAPKPAPPPRAASLKPRVQPLVAPDPAPVTRAGPTILTARAPEVRPFLIGPPAAMRGAEVFVGERVALTSAGVISADAMTGLQSEFLRLVATSPDGTQHALATPDGRHIEVSFERTQLVETTQANLRTIGYSAGDGAAVTRSYGEPAVVNVSVMCRDVAYMLPGQERGRFSACRGTEGQWMLARTAATSAMGGV